jgi:hypothetical protein
MDQGTHQTSSSASRGLLRSVERLSTRTLSGERPLATLLRLYVAANVAALTVALALGGPTGQAQAAAGSVWAWCRIG